MRELYRVCRNTLDNTAHYIFPKSRFKLKTGQSTRSSVSLSGPIEELILLVFVTCRGITAKTFFFRINEWLSSLQGFVLTNIEE